MNGEFTRPVEILSVEDNAADARMISELFKRSKVKANINFVSDGTEALDYLNRKGKFTDAVPPTLILLDLNLPKKDGRAVLKEVKEDKNLKHIPILILTTSNSSEDINQCYGLHANCYFSKPNTLEKLNETMRAIEECWLNVASLPAAPYLSG